MESKKIKNKIIALSGEPVSGKGTAVKTLIKILEEQGYTKDQIHLESTGNDFRRYFNSIIDLIINLNNDKELKNITEREELKKFFDNEKYRQILSKSIANLIGEDADVSNFSIEQANNREDFSEIRKIVDTLIDEEMKEKGKKINETEHPDEIWIIDSRLAFYNIPEAFSVRLTTNPDIAGERLFNDKTRGKEDSKYKNVEEAKIEREERRIGENTRYMKRYGVDLKDENNYDLIIDTSYAKPTDIANVILQCEKCYQEGKEFSKKWASPQIFLPLQTERDTLSKGMSMYNLDELIKNIQKDGYFPDKNIEVVEVDGLNYIIEGHHRNFAAAYAGNTLVPFEVIAKDDEEIPKYGGIARKRAESISLRYLYGHELFLEKNNPDFSYSKMFPKLYQKLQEREDGER